MKDYIISLLSVIIGTSILSTSVVNDKFKKNIGLIVSLIIAITALKGIKNFDLSQISIGESETVIMSGSSYETEIEAVINNSVEQALKDTYEIETVIVESDILIKNDTLEILSVNVFVSTNIELVNIWNFLRNHLGLTGDVTVTRIKDEGIK